MFIATISTFFKPKREQYGRLVKECFNQLYVIPRYNNTNQEPKKEDNKKVKWDKDNDKTK